MNKDNTLQDFLNKKAFPAWNYAKSASGLSTATSALFAQRLRSQQTWRTDFFDSKRECQKQLKRIKDRIAEEEFAIIRYLQNHQNSLENLMVQEFQRFKSQIRKMMDCWFEENRRQIREKLRAQGISQLRHIDQIRLSLNHIKRKIEEYERELQSQQYKKGIAAIVTTDFQSQGYTLVVEIARALARYEDKVSLKIDPIKLNRLRDQITSLIAYGVQDSNVFKQKLVMRTQPNLPLNLNPVDFSRRPENMPMNQQVAVQYVMKANEYEQHPFQSAAINQNSDRRDRSNRIFDSSPHAQVKSLSLHRNRDIIQAS